MVRVRFPIEELLVFFGRSVGLIVKWLRRGILTPEAWVQFPVRPFHLFLFSRYASTNTTIRKQKKQDYPSGYGARFRSEWSNPHGFKSHILQSSPSFGRGLHKLFSGRMAPFQGADLGPIPSLCSSTLSSTAQQGYPSGYGARLRCEC